MTDDDSTYVATTIPLVFALIPAGAYATMTTGAWRIAGIIVLVILIVAIGGNIGSQVTMHRTAKNQAIER